MSNDITTKTEDYTYFLNSFYFKGRWGRDAATGKSVRLQNDFMQINIKHCDTNETELKYIEEPYIDFYLTKETDKYTYPKTCMSIDELYKVRCKFSEREKTIAEHLGLLNEFYDACKRGRQYDFTQQREIDYKRLFIQEHLLKNPRLFMGDFDLEDYYKNLFMERHGRDVYHKHGCFRHGFLDIETDQFYDDWNISDFTSPINAVSYLYKPTMTLYLLALDNLEETSNIHDVKKDTQAFINEYIKPHAHQDNLTYDIRFYNSEEELLLGMWSIIHETKPDFIGIWNMNFDIPYILKRMTILGMDVLRICCHPDVPEQYRCVKYIEDSKRRMKRINGGDESDNTHPSRLWDWVHISGYTQFYDMMALYSLMRKRFILPSYRLDDIAESETGYGKLNYEQYGYTIRKLSHQNFKIFFSYSAIDTIRLYQIEDFTDDFNRSIIFADNTRLQTSQKISFVIKNKMYRIFLDSKPSKIIGNNISYNVREKISGAIIASPDMLRVKGIGILHNSGYIYNNVVDFDEASEYPRIIINFNISKNSIVGRINKIECNSRLLENPQEFNQMLQTRLTSIFDIGTRFFNLPTVDEMIQKIERIYDNVKK